MPFPGRVSQRGPYQPANALTLWPPLKSQKPSLRFSLAILPTPIHQWHVPGLPPGCELWVKRDDLTGMQLSGNKASWLAAEHAARTQGQQAMSRHGRRQRHHRSKKSMRCIE